MAVKDLKVESCTLLQVKQGERTSPFVQQREREMDWTLPFCRLVEGEEGVSNKEDGETERDRWMNGGVTFVAIFRGSLFFTCSDRERGRNADKMAQRKNKIKSN